MFSKVTVSVPATTANLGPGLDCLGLALDLYNEVTFAEIGSDFTVEVQGEGAGKLPADSSNLVLQAAERLFDLVGQRPSGLRVLQENRIPVGSGLGSSAAAVLSGILAANAMAGEPLNQSDLLELAVDMEGHPDNVAPALMGGLTIAVATDSGLAVERVKPAELQVAVVLPEFDLPTAEARRALPQSVILADAIFNVGRVALLVRALENGDYGRLAVAMQDRLHQPYRLPLIPGMAAAIEAGKDAGAAAVVLSGAGPSAIAFAPTGHDRIASAMVEAFASHGLNSRSWVLVANGQGSSIRLHPNGQDDMTREIG